MNQNQDISKIVLNVTLGAFMVPFITLYENKRGKVLPHLKSLKRFLHLEEVHNRIRITLALSDVSGFGAWKDGGYQNGILGMLQKRRWTVSEEIDGCFVPVPIDIVDAPGHFSMVSGEEEFRIISLLGLTPAQATDVMHSFSIMEVTTWLLFLFTIFVFQVFIGHYSRKYIRNEQTFTELLWLMVKTIFRQDFPRLRSKRIWTVLQLFLLLLFGAAFNSGFSTMAFIGEKQERINSLEDLLHSKRAPAFIQGESRHDLFAKASNPLFKQVYELAKKYGSSEPMVLDPLAFLDEFRRGKVFLLSSRVVRTGVPLLNHFHMNTDSMAYLSSEPYHRSLLSFLTNPKLNSTLRTEFYRRSHSLANYLMAAGISQRLMDSIPDDLLMNAKFDVTLEDIATRDYVIQTTSGIIKPLGIESFGSLLLVTTALYICASLVFTCPLIVTWLFIKLKEKHNNVNN